MTAHSPHLMHLFLVLIIPICAVACGSGPGLEIGQPAPSLSLPDIEGRNLALDDLRGQVVLLNFWATWCEPCKEEMPIFQSLLDTYGQQGLAVVLIALGDEPPEVAEYVRTHGYTFIALVDTKASTEQSYQTNTLPSTFLIDSEGILRERWIGPVDSAEKLAQHFVPQLPGQSARRGSAAEPSFTPLVPIASLTPTPTPTVVSVSVPPSTPSHTPSTADVEMPSPTPFPSPTWTVTPTSSTGVAPSPLPSPSSTVVQATAPVDTPTSPPPAPTDAPTATPTPRNYPAPVPVAPDNGAEFVEGTHAELHWNWDGELGVDEHFDVRFWQEGAPHYGVAWTRERTYQAKGIPGIAYYWAIAIVRGQEGKVAEQLSPESDARRMVWILPTPTPTWTSLPPTAEASYGLSLDCGDPAKTAPAGQLVVIDVNLTNTGTVQDTFDCSISESLPGGWQGMFCIGDKCYTSGVHPVTVPSGGTELVEVKIKSAGSARSSQGGSVTLIASSQGDPSKQVSVTVSLTVQ